MTLRDAYEMGRYVARHMGTQGARDRMALAYTDLLDGRAFSAYLLGRDRAWRMGEG